MPQPIPAQCERDEHRAAEESMDREVHGRAAERREYGFDRDRCAQRRHATSHVSKAAPVANGAPIFRFSDEAALRMERSGFFHH
jgi:hypothetical protein